MTVAEPVLSATTHARDAAYDIVLLGHVLAAVVGLGAVVISGGYAWALLRSGPGPESIRRYYRPGVNWGGRVLFLIPVLGVVLMAMSHGDWSFSDGWITIGLALWASVAVVAEMALWPAERRLQEGVVALGDRVTPVATPGAAEAVGAGEPTAADLRSTCLRVVGLSAVLAMVLVAAAVIMVAKP